MKSRHVVVALGLVLVVAAPAWADPRLADGRRVAQDRDGVVFFVDERTGARDKPVDGVFRLQDGRSLVLKGRKPLPPTDFVGMDAFQGRALRLADGREILVAPNGAATVVERDGRRLPAPDGIFGLQAGSKRILIQGGFLVPADRILPAREIPPPSASPRR